MVRRSVDNFLLCDDREPCVIASVRDTVIPRMLALGSNLGFDPNMISVIKLSPFDGRICLDDASRDSSNARVDDPLI